MRYYKVICPRGHVGTKRYATITFYFAAENALSAMDKGKRMGGIKHSRMPLSCQEITVDEYRANLTRNAYVAAYAK
jgi:hypothetical protein